MHRNVLAKTLDSIDIGKQTMLSMLCTDAMLAKSTTLLLSVAEQALREGDNQ